MTKTQSKIYLILLVILILGLIIIALGAIFFQKNQNTDSGSGVTPTPTIVSPENVIQITWEEAQKILDSCQIVFVFQKRNLEVTMTTKDQIFYKTKQPKLNDIINKINHLPSVCTETIEKVTE